MEGTGKSIVRLVIMFVAGFLIVGGLICMFVFVIVLLGVITQISCTDPRELLQSGLPMIILLGLGALLWKLQGGLRESRDGGGQRRDDSLRRQFLLAAGIPCVLLGVVMVVYPIFVLLSFYAGKGSQMDLFAVVLVPPGVILTVVGVIALLEARRRSD